MSIENRLLIIKILMLITIFCSFCIAFVTHVFFAKAYFTDLMGFASYQDSMVKLLGVVGLFVSILAFFVLRDPLRNRDIVISFIAGGIVMSVAMVYVINYGDWPAREYVNAIMLFALSIALLFLYPWNASKKA